MKKLFFTLCALCLCGTMWGQTQDTQYGLYYEVSGDEATIVAPPEGETAYSNENLASYSSIEGAVTIPAEVDGYSVVAVGASAFNASSISGTFVLPSYINTVGALAFGNCSSLTSVIIEYSAKELLDENTAAYNSMFYGSNYITKVELDRDITISYNGNSVVGGAFAYHYRIAEIEIGANVTEIPAYMFRSYFSNSSSPLVKVTSYAEEPPAIGNGAFSNANPDITLYTEYEYVNNYRLDEDWYSIFGNNIHSLTGEDPDWPTDELAFQYEGLWYDPIFDEYGNETGNCVLIADQGGEVYEGEITIPEIAVNESTSTSYTVTRIDGNAFAHSNIEGHLIIPANITAIGPAAFEYCEGLTEVTLEYAEDALLDENTSGETISFRYCSNLKTVNMYRNVTLSGTQTGLFCYHTYITTINIGPRVTEIPAYFFRNNSSTLTLSTINCYALSVPTFTYDPFSNLPSDGCTLNVPFGLAETYSSAHYDNYTDTWGEKFTIQEMTNAFAITTHDNGEGTAYATFYNGASDVELFDGELTAYYAYQLDTEEDGLYIIIDEIGNVIPANTGVVVETASEGTYLAIATGNTTSFTETNDLYGYDEAKTIDSPENCYYYLLSSYNEQVGFYYGAEDGAAFVCQAHRAYLAIPKGEIDDEDGNGSNGISIRKGNGGEDTTGISSVESATEGATVKGIYTIQGVRVSNMNQPGLYIVDGKKVLKR